MGFECGCIYLSCIWLVKKELGYEWYFWNYIGDWNDCICGARASTLTCNGERIGNK